ncbi:MAG: DUF1805 domain-containing protein [Lentisphaerae bacterium]|nr:DUF1805 domain-containing protein [Lentisphaerota bacterium]
MDKITYGDMVFEAGCWEMFGIKILLIKSANGALGCGYVNLAAAEKFGHALAIVSGVSSYEDMFAAEVKSVSSAAGKLGVLPGMSGIDALKKLS